jgi:hypothetical protein
MRGAAITFAMLLFAGVSFAGDPAPVRTPARPAACSA